MSIFFVFLTTAVIAMAFYFTGLLWKEIDWRKWVAISLFGFFSTYIIISGLYFWVDAFTLLRALCTEGILLLGGILYVFRKDKSARFSVTSTGIDMITVVIILLGLLISFEKFDYFGMGQDEGVYQVKAIELMYGHEERQMDFEEYHLLETEEQKQFFADQVKGQAGFDRYDSRKPNLPEEERLSPVSGVFHGIPTFPAILALWGKAFGMENMQQFHSLFFFCTMLFLSLTCENLKFNRLQKYLTLSLAAFCPVIHWVTKSTLTEAGLYFFMAAYLYAITSTSSKRNLGLSVLAIWTYSFYHISTFAMMPMFVVLYLILYFDSHDKNYLKCNIGAVCGFVIGLLMMLYVSPQYSFNNINNSIGHPGDDRIAPILLTVSAAVILLNLFLDKLQIEKLYRYLRSERIFHWLIRLCVLFCLFKIGSHAVQAFLGKIQPWRLDVQPYYEDGSLIQFIQHLGLVCMSISQGVFALPLAVLILLLCPEYILKSSKALVIGGAFLYCTILTAAFMKIEIYYFYYYARYLAPFLIAAAVGIGLLFGYVKKKWFITAITLGCIAVLLPFNLVLATSKDDSRLEWEVLMDVVDHSSEEGAIVVDSDLQLMFYLPLRAMTDMDVYPQQEDFDDQLAFLSSHYDRILLLSGSEPSNYSAHYTCLYRNFSHTSEDTANNVSTLLMLPTSFSQRTKEIILSQYMSNQLTYSVKDRSLIMCGSQYEYNHIWLHPMQTEISVYLALENYSMNIIPGYEIPFQLLNRTTQKAEVYFNGYLVKELVFTKDNLTDTIVIDIPKELVADGKNTITFAGESWSPTEYGSSDTRNILFSLQSITFIPES